MSAMLKDSLSSNGKECSKINSEVTCSTKASDDSILRYALLCSTLKNDKSILECVLGDEAAEDCLYFDAESAFLTDSAMLHPQVQDSCYLTTLLTEDHFSNAEFDIFKVRRYCKNLLFLCCVLGLPQMMDVILSRIIIQCSWDEMSHDLLKFACSLGSVDCAIAIVSHGVTPNGEHLITTVENYQPLKPSADNYLSIARYLLKNGCDPDWTKPYSSCCAIHVAAGKQDTKMTKLLIDYEARVDHCWVGDHTPLMSAIKNQSLPNIDLLLQCKPNLNSCACSGNCPLDFALEFSNIGLLMKLLERGACPNLDVDSEAISPLVLAASKVNLVMLWLLLSYGGNVNTVNRFDRGSLLITMCRRQSVTGVKLLLKYKADIDLETKLGTTALWAAVNLDNSDLVCLLLFVNSQLDIPSMEYHLYNPISATMLALYRKLWDLLWLLVSAGGTVNSSKIYRPDPTLHTIFQRNPDVRKQLLKWLETPKSLKSMCRNVVRRRIGARIDLKLHKVDHYPQALKQYILLCDVLPIPLNNILY